MLQANATEIAGTSFVALLDYMRVVILQDAALMLNDPAYSSHPIFEHQIFQSYDNIVYSSTQSRYAPFKFYIFT